MDVALSKNGAWILRVFFFLVVVFLYAPIVILLIFSFNDSDLPTFPLSGFTLALVPPVPARTPSSRARCETSAIVAALSSLGAVVLGILASIALVRRRFRGQGRRLGAAPEPARDPLRRLRDLAAPLLPRGRVPALDR